MGDLEEVELGKACLLLDGYGNRDLKRGNKGHRGGSPSTHRRFWE
jgi:hypothetical protein